MRLRVSTPTPQTNYRQSHSQVSPHLTHHNTSSLLSLSCITIAESATEGVVHIESSIALLVVKGNWDSCFFLSRLLNSLEICLPWALLLLYSGFSYWEPSTFDVYSTSLISVLISHAESSGILLLTWHLYRLIVFQFLFLLLILFCWSESSRGSFCVWACALLLRWSLYYIENNETSSSWIIVNKDVLKSQEDNLSMSLGKCVIKLQNNQRKLPLKL